MGTILLGLGAAGLVGLLVYGLVREGRRLMSRRAGVFRSYASDRNWNYMVRDDGRVEAALGDLCGAKQTDRASDDSTVPHNVIEGTVEEGRVLMFEQVGGAGDGIELPLHVALLEAENPFPEDLRVRTGDGDATGDLASEVPDDDPGPMDRNSPLRRTLRGRLQGLPWPVELRVRGRWLALTTTHEGALSRAREMDRLLEAARAAARTMNAQLDEETPGGLT